MSCGWSEVDEGEGEGDASEKELNELDWSHRCQDWQAEEQEEQAEELQ